MILNSRRNQIVLAAAALTISLLADTASAKHQDLHMTVIYGEDDRLDLYEVSEENLRKLADSTLALINARDISLNGEVAHLTETIIGDSHRLCKDEPFATQNSAAFCSGFLIGPDTILTAGHCVRSQSACENTRFVFGFAMTSAHDRADQVAASDVYECKELVHSVANGGGEDFAVIKITRPVLDHEPLKLSQEVTTVGTELTVIGHPSGLPTKVAGGASIRTVRDQYFIANLDTYGGNSGSAVFNTQSGEVEGILVRGEVDYVFDNGCRRSKVCSNEGCRGEDVTRIKQTFSYLEQ